MKQRLKKIKKILFKDELGILPASLTYYLVLAIIPILTITVLIASSFHISIDNVIDFLNGILPPKVSNYLVEIIRGKGFDSNIGLFNIVAFFVASNGTYAIIKTANNLYKVKDSDVVKDRLKSIIMLLNIVFLLIFLIIVPIFGKNILLFLQKSATFSIITDELIVVLNLVKWPLTFLVIFFSLKLMYTLAPSRQIQSKNTTIGAFVATILWIVSSVILGYYLQYFANYDILYGNLSSIIILMIWLYAISYVFVLGMIINTYCYKDDV